jgi:hypothetical protein
MPNEPDELTMKIEQRHRDAAVAWLRQTGYPSRVAEADMIERGEYDEHSLPQAFARFEASLTKRDDELADALERIATECPWGVSDVKIQTIRVAAARLRTAAARLRGGEREATDAMIDAAERYVRAERDAIRWAIEAALRAESQS